MIKYFEPKWKSNVAFTTTPIFSPEECEKIITIGRSRPREDAMIGGANNKGAGTYETKTRLSHISWIYPEMEGIKEMFDRLLSCVLHFNRNYFGYEGIDINEPAQYTEYESGGFYEWHTDSDVCCDKEPPVRKISMSLVLSKDSEYTGGGLELIKEGQVINIKQGHAVFFSSFINHRVLPVISGNRKSLVMWFGGPPFK